MVREGFIPVRGARLYYRESGHGQTIVILHGGPDFSHDYFLPEFDYLADSYRLIYYDQRGRGRSAVGVMPDDVTIVSEIRDPEALREYFQLDSMVVLGHSWGGLLAMEYVLHYPGRVSHLILMNTAPASHDDFVLFRQALLRLRSSDDTSQLNFIMAGAPYKEGDPDAVAAYYRIHFRPTIRRQEHLDRVIGQLRRSFTGEGILKARAIEERLLNETWRSDEYDLLPGLERVTTPTLVIHGDYDFIPAECAVHIAERIPGARYVLLQGCGHFSYLDCPEEIHREVSSFTSAI
jgi:proline iminopeptidase